MRFKIFQAILLSFFLYQQLHADQSKDEVAYAAFEASEYFSKVEYELVFFADVVTYRPVYWGSVLIKVKCIKETNKMFLDQKFIDINENTIQAWECMEGKDDLSIPVFYGRKVSEDDGYKIKLKVHMYPDITYKIKVEFSKKLNFEYPGIVYTDYRKKTMHPEVRAMIYTRMKKLLAHQVFPCFNNAQVKAKFRIKIGHLKNVNCFTNTKLISREPIINPKEWITSLTKYDKETLTSTFMEKDNENVPNGIPEIWVMDEFLETDPIEISSIALAMMDFNSVGPDVQMVGPPDSDLSSVEIRVWAEKDILDQMKEVLRVASQSLAFYSNFFGTPYNLGKLDLIVFPDEDLVEDYYGLIYLGEKTVENILTKSTHYHDGYLIVSSICQAVGKQWIGHLVPLSKENEKWFYDGLLSYLQRHCIVGAFPDWELLVKHNEIDAFITLLRTEERGRNYSQVKEFDYQSIHFSETLNSETKLKVNIVMRMLSFVLEFENKLFQKSLSNYIKKFRGIDATLEQVWNSLTTTINAQEIQVFSENVNVKEVFLAWLGRVGHPIINVIRNEAGNVITVTQERFMFPNENDTPYICRPIPFDIITKNQVIPKKKKVHQWLKYPCSDEQIPISNAKENDWIVLSLQLHVPARINYDKKGWLLIQSLFQNENEIDNVHVLTRIQIINDMFALAEASKLTYDFVFDTMYYTSHEKDDECLNVVFEELIRVRSRWIGTTLFEPFQKFVRSIIEPIFKKKVSSIEEFLRSGSANNWFGINMIRTACTFQLPDCKKYSENLLSDMIKNKQYEITKTIPDSLQGSFYCAAMIYAYKSEWNFLKDQYEKSENTSILEGLGCSSKTELLKNYVNWSIDVKNPKISAKIGLKVFEVLLSRNNQGFQIIRPFFEKRLFNKYRKALKQFIGKFKAEVTMHDFVIKALEVTRNEADLKMLLKIAWNLDFRKKQEVADRNGAISIVRRNINWFEKNERKLLDYFSTLSNRKVT